MQTTTFPTQIAEVDTIEPPETYLDDAPRVDPAIQLTFGWGLLAGENIIQLQRYVTQLDPAVALQVGQTLVEEASALIEKYPPRVKSDLIAATPAQAAQAAAAAAVLDAARA